MDITLDLPKYHVKRVAEVIMRARLAGNNEKLAVAEYCDHHGLTCMPDLFCLAIGRVERKKIARYSSG